MSVFGVTKGCAASIPVAGAMLDGGVLGLADSRLPHLKRLRDAFPEIPLAALRQPMRSEVAEIIKLGVLLTISDIRSARYIDAETRRAGRSQNVLVMIEAGDGREGVLPSDLPAFLSVLKELSGLRFQGLAINSGCNGGRLPDRGTMRFLDRQAAEAGAIATGPATVSAGNSSCWRLVEKGQMARSATNIRLGELILLGREAAGGEKAAGFRTDAFTVRAEVLESAQKMKRRNIVCALGRQDIGAGDLVPLDPDLKVDRLTSDHAVLSAPKRHAAKSGDSIGFQPSYFALQSLASSPYVTLSYISYNSKRSRVGELCY